jgi:hypothetical protein
MHHRKCKSISVVKGSNWIYFLIGALFRTAASAAAADNNDLSEQYHNVQSIPSIDAFEVHRLENTDTATDDTSSNDKYRTLKTSIAAFLITIGGLGILGWIYIAALRMKYNKQLKHEEKMNKRMEVNASNVNPYLDDEEQNNGCGNCFSSQAPHDESIAPFPIPMYPKDNDGHVSSYSPNRNIHETSFDGQFGITSQSPRHITSSVSTHFIPEDDVDSFARALRNAAIQDDLHWNEIQTKKQRMLDQQQQETHPVFRQQQPQDPTQQPSLKYDTSPRMKYMPQAFQTWNDNEYGDPGDVWLTSHSASTTGHSESETTSMSSYAGKNSSVEDGEHNEDVFKVMKNDRFNDMSSQHLLNPLRRGEDESSNNDDESFCQTMSIASGTSTSLGIPSVSASAIDRDPVTHGFFVINRENDLMDQYIPQDEYEAAVQAAVITLKNSPNSSTKDRMGDSRFDDEPLLRSSDDGTPQHLQPYKLTKSPHFVPSDEDNESPHRRVRSPSNKTTNSILNESIESSTTGGGTGFSTTESYESDPRKNKAIFHELKNVSVFLKNYEKKKSLKKKKNLGKFKLMDQGRAGTIPESDEQFDGLSVDTSTYDGSNLAPMSLASLATTKSEGEISGSTSSKRMGLYAFGRKKKGYISEKEVKSIEVKIKPKKKKSRSSKRSALPPRHGNSTPRSEALSPTNTFPAIGASPSGESAASERRFLTTEIESFFAQQGKGVYESIEVSPKSNIKTSPVVSRDEDINQSRSGSFDADITDLMNDENRASLAVNTRLGAAPFNPKESSPNMSGHFVEKFSSPRWKKMDTEGMTKSLWHEDSMEQKQSSPSIAHISSPNNIRNSSPSYIRNSLLTESSSSLKKDVSSSPGQSPKKLTSSPKNIINTNVAASPNSNRNPSPMHQSSTPSSKFSFEDKTLEDLPAPASIRERALRAKKDRELMGFPKRKNMNPSPPPPPPPPCLPPQHSPLAQSAKKILETGAKSFASIVERTRNQSPKNVVVGSTFPSSPSRLAPSHKDTTPIYVQEESFQDNSTSKFESKIQSSARSLMAMFENKSVDGNKSTDGTSLSSENKISERISNRLNQIRQSVKERTTGSGMNSVPAVVVEQKVERKQLAQDNAWITHDESKTNVPFHDTVLSTTMKNNSTASSSSTSNMLPNKIASIHSALKSSNEELSPKRHPRTPGKLLKQPLSSHGISKSPFFNQTSGQVSGDSPSKESAIERQIRGSSNNTSSYGFQHNRNHSSFDSKVRQFNKRNDDDKDDTKPESPTRRGNARNIINMFESKKTHNGIVPQSEHWQHTGTLRTKQQQQK